MEIWKLYADPKGKFKNKYEISNLGNVRKVDNKEPVSLLDNGKGYLCPEIGLYVHRMVAIMFIPNAENKPCVDHIDTNKLNNCVENLRWVTYHENNMNPITSAKMKDSWSTNLDRKKKTAETMKKTNTYLKRYYGEENTFSKVYKGTHYYNNGEKEGRFHEGEQPDGWVRGGLKR